jgi:YD repeat-containing protein
MGKKLFFFWVYFLMINGGYSQANGPYSTMQRVMPPTPEAMAINKVGFSDVNLYTGKASYSIPIYTITQNGISFPISLSYTGGGGIKVEEVASSVGLGWSLTSTGVVSRVIRGLADDIGNGGNYTGFINISDFPPLTTEYVSDYRDYAKNKRDGQPDLFSISVAGLSAQFYINRSKKVVFVEKSDLKVTIVFTENSNTIAAFKVTDMSGRTYYFSEQEKSKSIPFEEGYFAEYDDYATSSWYLTKITSEFGKDIMTFSYLSGESNQLKQMLRSPYQYRKDQVDPNFDEDESSYSLMHYKRPVLQKISFASGEVNFIMHDSIRYDMGNDKYLKQIVVKNYIGDTIKDARFNYSYFSGSGVIQQGQSSVLGEGNPALRLKLDSLQEISRNSQYQTHKFQYNTDYYLPDRLSSFSMDHWGFYNGQSNSSWEARHRVKSYMRQFPMYPLDSTLSDFGSANREPNLTYARAGVLKKVTTPTGGEVSFNYELNSSADSRLPNTISSPVTWYYPTTSFSTNYFSINLINEPFAYIRVLSQISEGSYSYEYLIKDSLQTKTFFHDTLVYGDANHLYKLEPGSYCIIQKRLGENSDPGYEYHTKLLKDIETLIVHKPVGGLRIRSMELYDPVRVTTLQRNYFYNESGDTSSISLSTGVISDVPSYGIQNVELWSTSYVPDYWSPYYVIPHGYVRLLTSAYPTGVTAGSFVGYKKVTVVDSNELKTESHFTSFKDFPEFSEGYYPGDGSTNFDELTINGRKYETHPLTPFDERDFLRGKLTKQIVYKKEGGEFQKIATTENIYDFNMGYRVSKTKVMLPDTTELLTGMVFLYLHNESDPSNPGLRMKKYNLYTTRYDLKKTIEKTYTYQGGIDSLVTETNIEYGDTPWFRDSLFHYQPTKITKTHSTGKEVTKIYYPYDWRYGVPDTTTGEMTNMKVLDTSNRIAIPVLQVVTDSATNNHVASVKNTYSILANSKLAVNLIKTKQGTASSFEGKISFNRYDTSGNLIEQQKVNDIKSSYIWDYKNSYPVAEVNNADSTSIAYTSFEAENKGNWSYSGTNADTVTVTGRKAYKLNGSNGLSKSGLNSGTAYILSYWTRNGSAFSVTGTQSPSPITGRTVSGWTYYEHKITGQTTVTLSGNGWVDEVRLYPMDAQMVTLTYEPLLGISSQCDANNRISYYEYDAFGRLAAIRDQDRNVVKRIRYNYTGQPETDYYYYNTSQSNSFTRNNCGVGYVGSTVSYTVSASVYSSSISQVDANKKALNDIVANGQNYANTVGTCTVVCNSGNCTGVDKKCVNSICETGIKVNTDSYWVPGMNKWACEYHYEWSDASWSSHYISYSNFACPY